MFNGQFGDGNQGQALPLTRLPLFFGTPDKDVLTAELWISRVQSAAAGAGWNNVQTMAHVYGALRSKAIIWFETLQDQNVPNFDHFENGFKERFIRMFGKTKASNASMALFHGLIQKQGEPVSDFFLRVSRAVKDLRQLLPVVPIPAAAQVADLPNIPAAFAVAANAADAIAWYQAINLAAEDRVLQAVSNQFVTAGVKKEYRDKILAHKNLREVRYYELCDYLNDLELNDKPPPITGDKPVTIVAAASADNNDIEVDAVYGRGRGRGRGYRGRGNSSSRGRRGGSHPSTPSGARFEGKCHFCQRPGHRKADCFKLKAQQSHGKAHATEAVEDGDHQDPYSYGEDYGVSQQDYYDPQHGDVAEVSNVAAFDYLN